MCGRYTSTTSVADLAEIFEVDEVRAEPRPARYNVAPTTEILAVVQRSSSDGENGVKGPGRALGTFRWGLVPSWAKDPSAGSRMINARSEGIASKPAYRSAFARRRCLIPADAFYEWQQRTGPDGRSAGKLPYAFRRKDGMPMAFAGLWEVWRDGRDPGSPPLRTCVIATTAANSLMADVHDRMPVVLAPEDWSEWLDTSTNGPGAVERLLVPAPAEWFDAYPVSTMVNNVANDGPHLLDPLPLAR
jgi:putative SOS response-associated peptidase YedK